MKPSCAANRSIRRSSALQKTVVKKSTPVASKAGKTTSWDSILDVSRARLTFSPRDFNFPEVVVRDFSSSFSKAFGLAGTDYVPFSSLCGKATSREFQLLVERAMLNDQTLMEYVNLYRADGAVLSCHIVVRTTRARRGAIRDTAEADQRCATLTVRSASSVGNANYVGIGLLGVDRIPQQRLERIIGREDPQSGASALLASAELLDLDDSGN